MSSFAYNLGYELVKRAEDPDPGMVGLSAGVGGGSGATIGGLTGSLAKKILSPFADAAVNREAARTIAAYLKEKASDMSTKTFVDIADTINRANINTTSPQAYLKTLLEESNPSPTVRWWLKEHLDDPDRLIARALNPRNRLSNGYYDAKYNRFLVKKAPIIGGLGLAGLGAALGAYNVLA